MKPSYGSVQLQCCTTGDCSSTTDLLWRHEPHYSGAFEPCELDRVWVCSDTECERTPFVKEVPIIQRCGTPRLANIRLTILIIPSPRTKPDARTVIAVSSRLRCCIHHMLKAPPMVLAKVNEGGLYIPIATAMPLGTKGCHLRTLMDG